MGIAVAALPFRGIKLWTHRGQRRRMGVRGTVFETFGGQDFPIFDLCPTTAVPRKVNAYSVGVPYKRCKLPGWWVSSPAGKIELGRVMGEEKDGWDEEGQWKERTGKEWGPVLKGLKRKYSPSASKWSQISKNCEAVIRDDCRCDSAMVQLRVSERWARTSRQEGCSGWAGQGAAGAVRGAAPFGRPPEFSAPRTQFSVFIPPAPGRATPPPASLS